MKKSFFIFYVLLINSVLALACANIPCESLPESFPSYEQAAEQIQKTDFKISESVNTSMSSWIRGLSYFSCDGRIGFLIMKTEGKAYIHQNVPLEVWSELKSADSFGSYYNAHVKKRYRILIN